MRSLLARYELRFSVARLCAAPLFFEVMGVLRKVWLVVLTLLTVVFLTALAVLSDPRPTQWLTDREVDELVYQDMIEKGFIDPETVIIIY